MARTQNKSPTHLPFSRREDIVCRTVVSVAAAAQADGSPGAMDRCTITNSILPASDELRTIADPIQLFGQDYNDCNGILSAMTPSHVATANTTTPSLAPSKKRKAKSSKAKGGASSTQCNKRSTATPVLPRPFCHCLSVSSIPPQLSPHPS